MERLEIKDLHLSAYLRAEGTPLHSIERRKGHVVFVFQANEKTRKLITKYIRDEASTNVRVYKNALRDLRSLAFGDIPLPKSGDKE